MKIPDGMTKEEVLEIIEQVTIGLAYKYRFGYYDLEDVQQEARIEAIKGLDKYQVSKGKLKTFLWTHVKNRLFNLRRDKYERYDKPCLNCPLSAYDPHCINSHSQCTAYDDKADCELYELWSIRNERKKNLVSPVTIGIVRDENEGNMRMDHDLAFKIDTENLIELLDSKMPLDVRKSWIKMRNDIKMLKPERTRLLEAIREILAEENYGGA